MFTLLPNTLILQNTICNQDYNNNNNPLSKRIKQKGKQKIASEEKFICIYVCSMMEMISLKNLENAERCLMRAEAHKAWKGGEIYFFEISFHVVGNWKKLYFEREYPVYCLERSMKLHPRRDTGFHENIWETTRRAWYPRIVHLFAASNLKSKSVHGRTRSNENIQESIVRYIGPSRSKREEDKRFGK